ncbi:Rieske (2Fe-2S) protein [Salinisphaera sp. SPP-AMP-43]|uniref:Rieske (2Fe-2S) protein n=1 Tax=Salinisphaera sp. SPP-AMP-43 TaxID=3121288 RepID=UPI003C6E2D23
MAEAYDNDIDPIGEYEEGGTFDVEIEGARYTIPNHCPHRKGWLAHGRINAKRKTISCPLHFSTFNLDTGEQIAGPPCGPLDVKRS